MYLIATKYKNPSKKLLILRDLGNMMGSELKRYLNLNGEVTTVMRVSFSFGHNAMVGFCEV